MVRAILELLEHHNTDGPAACGVLTAVLALSLIKAGCSKDKAVEVFAGYYDAVSEQLKNHTPRSAP